jgi:protein required for attachment to host cells
MNNAWILVAHRGGARLFESKQTDKDLSLLDDIPHPQGRLKSKDMGTDKPGRSVDSHGTRHALVQEQEPAAHVAELFSKHLARLLDDGRLQRRYDQLVLVAEPHFLGILRAALSAETAALVTAAVSKDLGHVASRDIARHLSDTIRL